MEAIRHKVDALQYACEELRDDREVVMEASYIHIHAIHISTLYDMI